MPNIRTLALSVPAHENLVIQNAAHTYGLSDEQTKLLYAIRLQENGGPGKEFGVLTPQATRFKSDPMMSLKTQAAWAAGTIAKHYDGNLQDFAKRYAPMGAGNDPNGLNANWYKNVKSMMEA